MTDQHTNPIRIPKQIDLVMKQCVDIVNNDISEAMVILVQAKMGSDIYDVMLNEQLERIFTKFVKDFTNLRMYVHTKENMITLNTYGFNIGVMQNIIYVCSEITKACMDIINDISRPALYRIRASAISGISIGIDACVAGMINLASTNMDKTNIETTSNQIAKYEYLLSKYELKLQQYNKMLTNVNASYNNLVKTLSASVAKK